MASYFFQHDAICPDCGAPALLEETGSPAGDWVEASCAECARHDEAIMEMADTIWEQWQVQRDNDWAA